MYQRQRKLEAGDYLLFEEAIDPKTGLAADADWKHRQGVRLTCVRPSVDTKMTLVALFFMHAKYSTPLTKIVIVSGFAWLVLLLAFTVSDYVTRGWLGVPGK